MILRLIGLLFGAAALVIGLSFGWGWPFGVALTRVNPTALTTMQSGVQGVLWQGAWDSLFMPLFGMPAWTVPAAICLIMFLVSAMRPGRG
ncbi:hypothetical protein AAFN86_07205 [Roseomonas sp. CAU 1739]|uniref:hypothetical protein n=1 Tax=Roseomonas sp. CAU 1739 TaxID=3140364 RepID=UPI00325A50F8